LKNAVATIVKAFQKIDILINNAGISAFGGVESVEDDLLDNVLSPGALSMLMVAISWILTTIERFFIHITVKSMKDNEYNFS
jgi:NAD(P)-dependent dehydrogenase (short-subunit alcohol dehydrogenase family)